MSKKEPSDAKAAALTKVLKRLMMRVWVLRLFIVFMVAYTEDSAMTTNPDVVNLWYIIFELTSALGISL